MRLTASREKVPLTESSETQLVLEKRDCVGLSGAEHNSGQLEGPVFLYYAMTNFFQNHRRYVMSRSAAQLT